MEVAFTFRNVESSEGVKTYARDKLGRLQKYVRSPITADVVLSHERHLHKVEISVRSDVGRNAGVHESEDMYASIDLVIDKKSGQVLPSRTTIFPPQEICAQVTDQVASCFHGRARGKKLLPATYEGATIAPLKKVEQVMAADVARAEAKRRQPIGIHLAEPLRRAFREESQLGDLVADVLRKNGHTDVGITNAGGVRADLPAGDLRYDALFEALPFENRLTVITLSGKQLRSLIAHNLQSDHGTLLYSGLHLEAACQKNQLKLEVTLDGGSSLDANRPYRIATSDFLALGGDDFSALGPLELKAETPTVRDLVASELARHGGTLRANDPLLTDLRHPRQQLASPRPMRCGVH